MYKHMPFIGVTPCHNYKDNMAYIKTGYCDGIMKVGGLPALIPLSTDERQLDEIIDRFDGFLIPGGPDVDPKYYNEPYLPFNEEISPQRDQLEMYVIRRAIQCNKPVLGICRGIQIMNVALGGTLYQDIGAQVKDKTTLKHSQDAPKWYPTHEINILKDSKVWLSFERKETARVNSFHHQAVKDVAGGFYISSAAADGIIESIESKDHKFAVGVQWHPELMWQEDAVFLNLFAEFVNCCK